MMRGNSPTRKVLIIENDPEVRNVIYVLLAGMECESEVSHGLRSALIRIKETSFDAVLLDLRCSDEAPEQALSQIKDARPSLVGRVLVITGEVTSPGVFEAIERQCLPQVPRQHLTLHLTTAIKAMF